MIRASECRTLRMACIMNVGDILIIKANEMHHLSNYFGKELYMFRTDLLTIFRSLNTVFTVTGICYTSYVNCLLVGSGWISMSSILTSLADSQHN
jgi:hypothetical protein